MNYSKQLLSLIIVCLLFGSTADAQLLYVDGVQMTMRPGSQVSVKGDIEVTNHVTPLFSNGTIDLTGNLTNNTIGLNIFGASQNGTVILNGGLQNINGVNGVAFAHLDLQGTGNKVLFNNCRVHMPGILSINDRVLDLNGNHLTLTNSAIGAITSTTGGILAEFTDHSTMVEWQVNATTGAHVFPFINAASDLIPFTYNAISGNHAKVNVSTYPTIANNTPYPSAPILVDHVRDVFGVDNSASTVDRFWYLSVSGQVGGSPVADLTFTYAPSEQPAAGNTNLRAQKWQTVSNGWEAALPSQSNPTAFSVRVLGVNDFTGAWALARDVSPLPIELLNFNAKPVDNEYVECTWQTASEINSDYFMVQRSKNGLNFENVGSIPAAGFSSTVLSYNFDDHRPYDGLSYYRLMMVDLDGLFEHSEMIPVNFTKGATYQVYPTLTQDVVNLSFNNETPQEIVVSNAVGQIVHSRRTLENNFQIDMSSFAPGIYFVNFVVSNKRFSERIVVLR